MTLNDGTRVHANQVSEGLLYWLAFAALPHIETPAILLVEEPEYGLHPSGSLARAEATFRRLIDGA
ncbi:MAG TPA: AAA family ATPase [Kofleriaceae bacterium]